MTTWGSTEAGDPVFDNSWVDKLQDVNLIISKALSKELMFQLLDHQKKCIFHLTVTGFGGSKTEPCVPTYQNNAKALKELLDFGFPKLQTVLRIDPMIDVELAKKVLDQFKDTGVIRCRFSFLNLTNHTDNTLSDENIQEFKNMAVELVEYSAKNGYNYTFESCAGPWLKGIANLKLNGCMSKVEAEQLLGKNNVKFENGKRNRDFCLAPKNRVELLNGLPCGHKCTYCFWGTQCKGAI